MRSIEEILNYKVFGLALKDPIAFCIKALVIFLLVQLVVMLIKFVFNPKRKGKHKMELTTTMFFRRFLISLAYILGVAYILFLIPALATIGTSILASAGILAAAIGLASQEALSNLVGGVFIIFAKPFRIGDYVEIESGEKGTIHEITLRHTVIRTAENKMVIIPNAKMNSCILTNATIQDSKTCAFIEVDVAYKENIDRCFKEIRALVENDPRVIDIRTKQNIADGVEKIVIRVVELGQSAVKLRAYAWTNSPDEAFTLKCDMLKAIKERFEEVGIEIPYPYMNIQNN